MMTRKSSLRHALCGALGVLALSGPVPALAAETALLTLPYAAAGLDQRQAATLLLERIGYGARPGEVDQVLALGLERWLEQQLAASNAETRLDAQFASQPARYSALRMNHAQLVATFPGGQLISADARRFHDLIPPPDTPVDNAWRARKLEQFRQQQGYRTDDELYQQLVDQKLTRALLSSNPLKERMVDFWQNHFFASSSHFRSRPWLLPFEQEALRPQALGRFRDLLGAAVKHPALLQLYRDGARKSTLSENETRFGFVLAQLPATERAQRRAAVQAEINAQEEEEAWILQRRFWPANGANPELAQALLERYTLGEPGKTGYTAADVDATARILTGWSTAPLGPTAQWFSTELSAAQQSGFVRRGSFLFRADWHDAQAKQVLGRRFAAGGGLDEGEQLLDLLATQPATAQHIAHKLAQRFASGDDTTPPAALVDALAQRFQRSGGDLTAVLRTLFAAPEFWQAGARHDKAKTPFEYAVSALRANNAELSDAKPLTEWLGRMGQAPYAYLSLSGEPEAQTPWLQPAALLMRWNFAQGLAAGEIAGIALPAATDHAEPNALALRLAAPEFQMH